MLASGEFGDDRLLRTGHVDVELPMRRSADQKARGVRSFIEMVAREKRVSATAIQTVGVKGHEGIAVARLND
jgi:predicted O-methyltransferase YrrM